jgi:hypothetical protein
MGSLVAINTDPSVPRSLTRERLVLHFVPKVVLLPEPRDELGCVASSGTNENVPWRSPVNRDVPLGSSALWKTPL